MKTNYHITLFFFISFCSILFSCKKVENSILEPNPVELNCIKSLQLFDDEVRTILNYQPNKTIIGTWSGKIYSSDSLDVWHYMGEVDASIFSTCIDSTGNFYFGTGSGVYKSYSNGVKWDLIGLKYVDIRTLCTDKEGNIFAGTNLGIFQSNNFGNTWNRILLYQDGNIVYSIKIDESGIIYAGTYNGVIRSDDKGQSWNYCGLKDSVIKSISISKDGVIFAGIRDGGVFSSTNQGNTWMSINDGLIDKQINYILSSNTQTICGTRNGKIFYLGNGNISWNQYLFTNNSNPIFSLSYNSTGCLFIGTTNAMLRSISPIN